MHVTCHINFTGKLSREFMLKNSWINHMDFYFMRNSPEMNLAINN